MAADTIPFIGNSRAIQDTLDLVSGVAAINRPALVIGERGTGKELIAARLHFLSPRWDRPFIRLNCAALTESLLETELFGHEAGAFTGATQQHRGRFEQADGGSLFLDELATMSLRLQEKILRVIEYGEFERVGGRKTLAVDVRIIAATNADLQQCVRNATFRADLLDRLAFAVLTVPPVRLRGDDVILLAEHFAMGMVRELGLEVFAGFSPRAHQALRDYHWPGNVREIKNVAERAIFNNTHSQEPIDSLSFDPFTSPYRAEDTKPAEQTPPRQDLRAPAPTDFPIDLKAHLSALETQLISRALQCNHFHQRHAAQDLGLSYHQLRALLRKYPQLSASAKTRDDTPHSL